MKKDIDFGEKTKEYDPKTGEELEVWQSPKYKESKQKATEMIESEKYNLTPGDFWILMNKTKSGNMAYTGLIISHNGCLKVNDTLDNPVKSNCFSLDKEGYGGSLVYTYIDEDVYEVGEFNSTNGKNPYPYAMAFKRCFDRVVLKKSKLAYAGIYSEVEADEFKENNDLDKVRLTLLNKMKTLVEETNTDYEQLLEHYKVESNTQLTMDQLEEAIKVLETKKEKKEKSGK